MDVDVKRNDKINTKYILKNKYKKIVISPGPGILTNQVIVLI